MRHRASSTVPLPAPPGAARGDWHTIRTLLPYLWAYRWRVGLALALMVAAKASVVGVPVLLKGIVDSLSPGDRKSVV